jgi:ribosome-associated toxin RatA of RatAB toxin-antitoxin module
MLQTESRISISAPPETVFTLAADVARWPEFLSHYRYVHILDQVGDGPFPPRRRVRMGACRGRIPVWWTAAQVLHPWDFRIHYHHVAGLTRGMDVEWRIEPRDGICQVTILHRLISARPWLRWPLAEWVVGTFFVQHIAQRTLQGIKVAAEDYSHFRDAG